MSQTERLVWIDERIRGAGGLSAGNIADKFEISERQAKRDIEYLRERCHAPVEYVRERARYEYLGEFEGLGFAQELAFFDLAFVRALVDHSSYIPFLTSSFKRSLDDKLRHYASISDKLRYELPDLERPKGEIAKALCGSLLGSKVLALRYVNSKGELSTREILPLVLVNYGGKWYCVARDEGKAELRTFSLARMEELKDTGKRGTRPPEGEVETFLSSSYGIFKGRPMGIAKLRISGGAARAIRLQTWHPAQKIVEIRGEPEPEIELSVPAHDWSELLGRALTCGSHCEVLEPPEFRELWAEEIRKMAQGI